MEKDTFINEGWVKQNDLIATLHKEVTDLKTVNDYYVKHSASLDKQVCDLTNKNSEYIEALRGVAKALQRVLDKHDPDSIEYEWIGEANDIILKATGKNLNQ